MRFWVDIYNAAGERQGSGPVRTLSASVRRVLDGAGSLTFTVPATDERALALCQNEARARLFYETGGVIREVGRGIIQTHSAQDQPRGWSLRLDGSDILDELRRMNTLLGRRWSNESTATIIEELIDLVPGWSADVDSSTYSTARFDGVSVLKAVQKIAEQGGAHLRLGSGNTLEFGAFGADSGLWVTNLPSTRPELHTLSNRLFIESMTLVKKSEDLINWIIPLGAGEGDAALTLEQSTRTTPYTITPVSLPDGRTAYALLDSTSIAAHGTIQKVVKFQEVAAITNGEQDQINAANALYDYAANWLQRNAVIQESYRFRVRKPTTTIRPGDKLHIRYTGVVYRDGKPIPVRDIDDDFWVVEVTENFGKDGVSIDLIVSNVDKVMSDEAAVVLAAVESIQLRNVSVQPYYVVAPYVWQRDLDSTHPATVPVVITNAVARLERVYLRIQSAPFRSTAKSPAHRHRVAQYSSNGTIVNGATGNIFTFAGDANGSSSVAVMPQGVGTPGDLWTYDAGGAQEYGIYDDTTTPEDIRISIDGVDRTAALGGPWGTTSSAIDEELVITDYLLSPLQGRHEIEFTCDAGQGTIEAVVELYMLVQSIAAQGL